MTRARTRKKPASAAGAAPTAAPPTALSDWFEKMPPENQIRFAAELVESSRRYGEPHGSAARKSAAVALRLIADRLDTEEA